MTRTRRVIAVSVHKVCLKADPTVRSVRRQADPEYVVSAFRRTWQPHAPSSSSA